MCPVWRLLGTVVDDESGVAIGVDSDANDDVSMTRPVVAPDGAGFGRGHDFLISAA